MQDSVIYQVVAPAVTAGAVLLIAWLLKRRADKKGQIVDPVTGIPLKHECNYDSSGTQLIPVVASIGPESTFTFNKRPELISRQFIKDLYACMEHGRKKYGPQSVEQMLEMNDWRYCFDALIRHATRYEQEGELEDKDSGLHPMVHVATRAMILYMKDNAASQ